MSRVTETAVLRIRATRATATSDLVAVERPLEIGVRLGDAAAEPRRVSLTMRTPGDDGALAVGFLHAERVISEARAVRGVEVTGEDAVVVDIHPDFRAAAEAALGSAARTFVTTGACGVCGRTSIAELTSAMDRDARAGAGGHRPRPEVTGALVHELPARLRAAQQGFAQTGGLHAAGLFTADGTLHAIFEDVGRHNAVDKLVGTLLLQGRLPAGDSILVVSGRASFELVQKAAVAGIPVMVAVGAPSSLAIEIASGADMTLVGFARDRGFNVYTGTERIVGLTSTPAVATAAAV